MSDIKKILEVINPPPTAKNTIFRQKSNKKHSGLRRGKFNKFHFSKRYPIVSWILFIIFEAFLKFLFLFNLILLPKNTVFGGGR